jgi:hypothetical protein
MKEAASVGGLFHSSLIPLPKCALHDEGRHQPGIDAEQRPKDERSAARKSDENRVDVATDESGRIPAQVISIVASATAPVSTGSWVTPNENSPLLRTQRARRSTGRLALVPLIDAGLSLPVAPLTSGPQWFFVPLPEASFPCMTS